MSEAFSWEQPTERAKINQKISSLNDKVAKLSIPSEAVSFELSIINKQISEANQNRTEIRQKVDQEINNDIALWKNKSIRIDDLKLEKAELGEELNQHREILESGSANSFIHRMAGIYYGVENLADLSEEQIGIFKLIFMISVAAVVSTTGPILTFVLSMIALSVIPFSESFVISDINVGILYLFAISSLSVYGIIMAGWGSNSK